MFIAYCDNRTYSNSNCQFVNLNNNALYVNSKDIINLKIIGYKPDLYLRSHDFTFTINDETFQEVIGHKDRIGANDEVC